VQEPTGLLYAAAIVFGYLLGSIPFGLLLTRFAGTQDIRTVGSGNIGATNVLRTGRKSLAAATLLCDVLKGTIAVAMTRWLLGQDAGLFAGLGAFIGHLFPLWLRFKGGKGVATYLGILIAVAWPGALAFAAIWIAVAGITRYSSLAALVASGATAPIVFAVGYRREALILLAMTVLIWIMHRTNIGRLIRGTEGKIGGASLQAVRTEAGQ
jgi:glycerol-3-phosphate acyltransferase PlsY